MQDLIKMKIKIGDLFKKLNIDNNKLNVAQKSKYNIYIKTPLNELVKINAFVKKSADVYNYSFSNNISLKCSNKHLILDENYNTSLIGNSDTISTIYGTEQKINEQYLGNRYVYDISIPFPHLYTTPNGIIHHNTTLAELLCKELNAIKLFIPCGTNGNIDTVRTTIKEFLESKSIDNNLKIVILDEFDSASGAIAIGSDDTGKAINNTMMAMRSLIEEHQDDTRFILTCNHLNKIIGPIQSRCPPISVTFSAKDVLVRIIKILDLEKIKYDKVSIKLFLENTIKKNFPDIRRMISVLQNSCSTGTLIVNENDSYVTTPLETFAKDVLEAIKVKKPQEVRQLLLQNKSLFNEEYSKLAVILLNLNIENMSIEKTKKAIECIYRIDHVVDQEIQFYGFILEFYN